MTVRPNASGPVATDTSPGPLSDPSPEELAATLSEAYAQYWLLPESSPIEDYRQLFHEITALETALPLSLVTSTLEGAATDFHATTGHCPFCRQPGPLHLRPDEQETTNGPEA
jgi:hypothetical protein